jgi:hypothetical protein
MYVVHIEKFLNRKVRGRHNAPECKSGCYLKQSWEIQLPKEPLGTDSVATLKSAANPSLNIRHHGRWFQHKGIRFSVAVIFLIEPLHKFLNVLQDTLPRSAKLKPHRRHVRLMFLAGVGSSELFKVGHLECAARWSNWFACRFSIWGFQKAFGARNDLPYYYI